MAAGLLNDPLYTAIKEDMNIPESSPALYFLLNFSCICKMNQLD